MFKDVRHKRHRGGSRKIVHLHVHSPFSFLDGGSSIDELTDIARDEMDCLALTDHDNVSGAVRFAKSCSAKGIKPIQGAEVTLAGGFHLVLLAQDPDGYANLCGILTKAHLQSPRRKPALNLWELGKNEVNGLFALSACRRGEIPGLILRGKRGEALSAARRYADLFGKDRFFLELEGGFLPYTFHLNRALWDLGKKAGIQPVISCNVHYGSRSAFPVHDILTCVRTLTKVHEIHPERKFNSENYLKTADEIESVLSYCGIPAAPVLENAAAVADACEPSLKLGVKRHPKFPLPEGTTARQHLRRLAFDGAATRYGKLSTEAAERLERELLIISELGFDDYFLVAWDVARFARERGIMHAGRGSAADSAVAYCLGITNVDALSRNLMFERFMSLERGEPPDIDIDFDARYRDDVASYVENKYGSERVATVCTFNTFGARSAVRDLGKALDLPESDIDMLAKRIPYVPADAISRCERLPELRDCPVKLGKYKLLLDLCEKVSSFPRHIGAHLGGLVIGDAPLTQVMPLQHAAKGTVIGQFDKDDVEDVGLVKLDLLSLRMLSAVQTASASIEKTHPGFQYEDIPLDDAATYKMIRGGETIAAFQLESPAQRNLQVQLGARNIEDVIASVALIRPGPVKGNMVKPFIARRRGEESPSYLHPKLEPILRETHGIVLFQEQVIQIASSIAGFTPGESDRLRRVMTHNRSAREMEAIGKEFIQKARENGITAEQARDIFSCISGYAGYGFCEAHAAAFGVTAYKTAYLLKHFPAHFYAAVLSHQPMGYYSPGILALEAKRRGIRVAGPDVNRSGIHFDVQISGSKSFIRASLASIKGVGERAAEKILRARGDGPFQSIEDFLKRTGSQKDAATNLALCGAFDSLVSNRRRAIWEINGLHGQDPPDFTRIEKILGEMHALGFSTTGHIAEEIRRALGWGGLSTTSDLKRLDDGSSVKIVGIPFRPHRPPTRSGKTVVFFTLEDELGLVDVTVFEPVYQKRGALLFAETLVPLLVSGRLQRVGAGTSLIALDLADLRPSLQKRFQLLDRFLDAAIHQG